MAADRIGNLSTQENSNILILTVVILIIFLIDYFLLYLLIYFNYNII